MITTIKLFFIILLYSANSFAVCILPISRTNINGGQIPTAVKINADFDVLYAQANTLPGDCIADNSVLEGGLADDSVATAKIADATITLPKFAEGVFPVYGKPLRIKAFTASSSWVKGNDVGSILVQVIGGGGGAGLGTVTAGGTSSFGAHCIAGGGGATATINGGAGGIASNGDININGTSGRKGSYYNDCFEWTAGIDRDCGVAGVGGSSLNPYFGRGGMRFFYAGPDTENSVGGGGGGAYCSKLIQRASLSDSVAVTVGAGGNNTSGPSDRVAAGVSGLVLIYEFSK